MKVIDKLPYVNFRKLVKEPIKYIMDVWEFIVVFYTVVNGTRPKDKGKKDVLKDFKIEYYYDDIKFDYSLKPKYLPINFPTKDLLESTNEFNYTFELKNNKTKYNFDLEPINIHNNLSIIENSYSSYLKKFIDMFSYYDFFSYLMEYLKDISNEELKQYLQRYIDSYREGKIYGKKTNYQSFSQSQEIVFKLLQKSQEKYGNCVILDIPNDTEEDKEIRFFEIIAYLYLNGNIQITEFSIEEDDKELFLQIRILHDINSLYGITIDKDKNVLYKGKKVDITYKKDEFTLIKELVDNKGKIDKQKFFEQVKWGNNAEKNKNRMNGLKNRVLSKLKKCGAENLKISQAGAYIELKEGEK